MRALIAILLAAPALAQAAEVTRPTLRRAVTVASEVVRIGDLVENAGAAAAVPIFRSPDLGTTGTVTARRVFEAIRPHTLLAVDTGGIGEIAVTRASQPVSPREIETRIVRALADRYGFEDSDKLRVSIDGDVRTLHLDPSVRAEIEVERAHYEPRTGRFAITLSVPGGAGPQRYTGTLIETAEAAVLIRPLGRGEIVRAADLRIERRPKSEISAEIVAGIDAAGLAARQPLRAGQLLRRGDLMRPEMVRRDEIVTLIYEAPGIHLTIRGKALDAGAHGDLINVLNIQSKRTVQGTVAGPGRIAVAALVPAIAAAPDPSDRRSQ